MRLRATHTVVLEPVLPEELSALRDLAYNLFWTWHTDAAALFERIDREAWNELGHNPVRLLQVVPPETWARLVADDGFRLHLDRVRQAFADYMHRPGLASVEGTSERDVVAYFSLEFALTESFPNYSGGLGVLAGDHLKSASDLGLPLVGVGLLYHQGYFLQALGPDGWQREEYADIDVSAQPVRPVLDDAGGSLTVQVPFNGREVTAAIWRLDVGKVPLFLLDADLEQNAPEDRAISSRLYGGDNETRIQQELLLGIGGVRMLHALGLHAAVCHMNEGHSALLGVERVRMMMEETGASFAECRLPVTAATVFTTHTAVAAGIDLFAPELVTKYLEPYYTGMGLDAHTFLGLGRTNANDDNEPFSMAVLGLRLSGRRNGVSRLHERVSRKLWESAWPELPEEETPIASVTNGVHLPTWVSHEVGDLFDRHIGAAWRDDPTGAARWSAIHEIPDEELWNVHQRQRERLIARARARHSESLLQRGLAASLPGDGQPLDPRVLTIGFARRFAGYKRATLLFRDPPRLAAIVNDPERPVQFIFAGKAHPRDEPAKQLIREVLHFSAEPEFRDRLVLLERYDVDLARSLVQGCDVWLNTPLRPLEASGTSGMKACANGAIHLSVRDGWWWEAYRPGLGWAIGRERIDDDPETQDAFDANSLYELLEQEVTPAFYERDGDGVPRVWVQRMKASIEAFAPVFNTSRMVNEYVRDAYVPAAASWHALRAANLELARDQAAWLTRIHSGWSEIKVCSVEGDPLRGASGHEDIDLVVQLHLGPLSPSDVRVDAVYGPAGPDGSLSETGATRLSYEDRSEDGVCRFTGSLKPTIGGRFGYAIRVLPDHPNLRDPFAAGHALWA